MGKPNLLSGRDKELQELAEQYELAKAENSPFYLDADDFADLADWYGTKMKYAKALEITEYGLTLHPDNTALLVEQAYLFLDTGRSDEAYQIVETITDNYSPEVKVLRAHLLLYEGDLVAAESLLDTIENKEDLANIIEVSYMYLDMGYSEKAMAWLKYGIEQHAEKEEFIALMADCNYAEGLMEEAVDLYNKLIDINPYSAPYWYGLARCQFENKLFDKAIEACDYALISDEDFIDAHVMKGHCFFQLGNEDAALESYQIAEQNGRLPPDFIYTYIGLCKFSKGEWEEGYENLEKAIQYDPDVSSPTLPTLYSNAGFCLHKLGKKRKAHQYCKKARELAPEDAEHYLVEGRIYMEEGKYDKGIKQWETAVKLSPTSDTWHEIGSLCLDMGEIEYAKVAFEHVRELEETFEFINEKLAITYMMLQDKENFHKYNQLCAHPINLEEMKRVIRYLEEESGKGDVAHYMQKLLLSLQ